jgi:hypothetical protein
MFSDEVAVTYPAVWEKDWQKSVFVPRAYVLAKDEHGGEVLVTLVEHDGAHYAVLPSQDRDIVRPQAADLRRT